MPSIQVLFLLSNTTWMIMDCTLKRVCVNIMPPYFFKGCYLEDTFFELSRITYSVFCNECWDDRLRKVFAKKNNSYMPQCKFTCANGNTLIGSTNCTYINVCFCFNSLIEYHTWAKKLLLIGLLKLSPSCF